MQKAYNTKLSRIVIRYGEYTVDFCTASMCITFWICDVAQVMEDLRNNLEFINDLPKCLLFVFRLRIWDKVKVFASKKLYMRGEDEDYLHDALPCQILRPPSFAPTQIARAKTHDHRGSQLERGKKQALRKTSCHFATKRPHLSLLTLRTQQTLHLSLFSKPFVVPSLPLFFAALWFSSCAVSVCQQSSHRRDTARRSLLMLHQFRNQLEFLDPHARGQARGHQNRACHRRLQRWLPNCRTRAAGGANHLDANLCTRRRSSEEVKKASAALQEQLMFVYLVEWLLKSLRDNHQDQHKPINMSRSLVLSVSFWTTFSGGMIQLTSLSSQQGFVATHLKMRFLKQSKRQAMSQPQRRSLCLLFECFSTCLSTTWRFGKLQPWQLALVARDSKGSLYRPWGWLWWGSIGQSRRDIAYTLPHLRKTQSHYPSLLQRDQASSLAPHNRLR